MKRGGFTLIELLVVIAIIAILAAILFPVFMTARESAKTATCLAHVKELGQAMLLYTNDSGDVFPTVLNYNGKAGNNWDIKIHKYAKSQKIFQCPIQTIEKSASSFGMNLYLGWKNFAETPNTPVQAPTLSSVKRTSKVVLLCDSQTETYWRKIGEGNHVWSFYDARPVQYWKYRTGLRHRDGDNFCFVDGHAKWMEMRSVQREVPLPNGQVYTWKNSSFRMDY